jgi:hypothetical protein
MNARQELFGERAAIRQHDGGLPRHVAEMRAYEDVLAHRPERHGRFHRGGPAIEPLYALTIYRPWTDAILHSTKRFENRKWPPWKRVMGRRIAIHAGKKYDREGAEWMLENDLFVPPAEPDSPTGVVGVARIAGVVESSDDPWFVGRYGWRLVDVVELPQPVRCLGTQKLWLVSPGVTEEIYTHLDGLAA